MLDLQKNYEDLFLSFEKARIQNIYSEKLDRLVDSLSNLHLEGYMKTLNLETKNKEQELIKAYLQENGSDTLIDKINCGSKAIVDGKQLINKKDLDGFMKYASDEAKKLAESESNSMCVQDSVVFGWAIHYFEEDAIIGTLFNSDGSKYVEVNTTTKNVSTPTSKVVKTQSPQMSLFDLKEVDTDTGELKVREESDDNDDVEEETTETPIETITPPIETKPISQVYVKYMEVQEKYPDSVVAYRLGDFYEFMNESAVKVSFELGLTLTGRECGLPERVPLCGIPYHASDSYFRKLAKKHKLVIIESDGKVVEYKEEQENIVNSEVATGRKTDEAIKVLNELFGDILEVRLCE